MVMAPELSATWAPLSWPVEKPRLAVWQALVRATEVPVPPLPVVLPVLPEVVVVPDVLPVLAVTLGPLPPLPEAVPEAVLVLALVPQAVSARPAANTAADIIEIRVICMGRSW
jgi:hypothetical protein